MAKEKKKEKIEPKITGRINPLDKIRVKEYISPDKQHNFKKLGASSVAGILKGKAKNSRHILRQLIRGEMVRANILSPDQEEIPSNFKKIWKGLQHLQNDLVEEMSKLALNELARVKIPKEFKELLEEVLIQGWRKKIKNESPQSLLFNKIAFSEESFEAFISAMHLNATIKALNFDACDLEELQARQISNLLRVHPTLNSLHIDNNKFGSKGLSHIAKALKDNRILLSLSLKNNGIKDKGVIALSEILAYNRTIRNIDLSNNEITSIGINALKQSRNYSDCNITLDDEII